VKKLPKGIHLNVLLKINSKLGGINHVLASRLPNKPVPANVKDPIPAALSWIFENKSTMVVGLDFSDKISRLEDLKRDDSKQPKQKQRAYMGLVASMDSHVAKYGAFLCAPEIDNHYKEIGLGMTELFGVYFKEQATFPTNIIVFRDGVSDSEFAGIDLEVDAIKKAYKDMSGGNVRVTVIMCIKRHRVRFFYEEEKRSEDTSFYHNPCPGVCVDGTANVADSITGDILMEFYLNSHSPIQGTCHPMRYVVVHDDIGFKVS
jgi:eukaryotic translation initiation factor 2C